MDADINNKEIALRAYSLLSKRTPPVGSEYCVVVYLPLAKVQDGKYGLWYCAGCYCTREKACAAARDIIYETGISTVYATKCCQWEYLDEESKPDRIEWVPADKETKYRLAAEEKCKREMMKVEADQKLRSQIEAEQLAEANPDTIEAYTKNYYAAIRNYAHVQCLKRQLVEAEKEYQRYSDKVKTLGSKHPEYREQWLPRLKDKLTARSEMHHYQYIEAAASELKL